MCLTRVWEGQIQGIFYRRNENQVLIHSCVLGANRIRRLLALRAAQVKALRVDVLNRHSHSALQGTDLEKWSKWHDVEILSLLAGQRLHPVASAELELPSVDEGSCDGDPLQAWFILQVSSLIMINKPS